MRLLLVGGEPAGATAAMQAYSAGTAQVVATARRGGSRPKCNSPIPPHRGSRYVRPECLPRDRHPAIPARLELPRHPGMNLPDADHLAEGRLIL